MKSEQVTRAWEFYRDNCTGFKEPMRREMRKLDDYVASAEAENVKLRELLQRLLAEYRYMSIRPRKVYMQHEERMRVIEEEMRELGIEVEV